MILIIPIGSFSSPEELSNEEEYPGTLLAVKDFFTFVPGKEILRLRKFEDRGSKWLMYSISTASPIYADIGYSLNLDNTIDIANLTLKEGETFEDIFSKVKKAVAFIIQLQNYIKNKRQEKYLPLLRNCIPVYVAAGVRSKKNLSDDKKILKIVKEYYESFTSPIRMIKFDQYEQEEKNIKENILEVFCQIGPTMGGATFLIDLDKNSLIEAEAYPGCGR